MLNATTLSNTNITSQNKDNSIELTRKETALRHQENNCNETNKNSALSDFLSALSKEKKQIAFMCFSAVRTMWPGITDKIMSVSESLLSAPGILDPDTIEKITFFLVWTEEIINIPAVLSPKATQAVLFYLTITWLCNYCRKSENGKNIKTQTQKFSTQLLHHMKSFKSTHIIGLLWLIIYEIFSGCAWFFTAATSYSNEESRNAAMARIPLAQNQFLIKTSFFFIPHLIISLIYSILNTIGNTQETIKNDTEITENNTEITENNTKLEKENQEIDKDGMKKKLDKESKKYTLNSMKH